MKAVICAAAANLHFVRSDVVYKAKSNGRSFTRTKQPRR